ncbi:hypothetical protein [uncultured Methanolobus sp.]|uniref:hypothetical protein n=1 Tax=uncultured Methanolobus sp. TaxID=218300 RepID=UPI0029C90738|nr:hypothetical protein [uncultured Methanolobus sp.]
MNKIILLAALFAVFLVSGCIDNEPTVSPTEQVYNFASSYDTRSYDTCYQMMTSDYQDKHPFANFIDGCKALDSDEYQFIGATKEYINDDTAIVDVQYNQTRESLDISWSGIGTEIVTETKEDEVKLVNERGEWKFTVFPVIVV